VRQPLSAAPMHFGHKANPCNSPCAGDMLGDAHAHASVAPVGASSPQQAIQKQRKPKCSSRMAATLAFLKQGKLQAKPKLAEPAKGGYKRSGHGPVPLVRASSMKRPVLVQKSAAATLSRSATWPRGNVLWEPEGAALMKEELNRMMDEGLHMPMSDLPKSKDIFCGASASPNFIDDMSRDNHEIMEMLQSLNETTQEEDAFDLADCIASQVFGGNPC